MHKNQTALITGASLGIGLEFAKLLARDHYDLVLVARDASNLEKIAEELRKNHSVSVSTFAIDLSLHDAGEKLVSKIEEKNIAIDILINNAGFGDFGYFKDTDWKKEEKMIQLNIVTLTHLTKIFVNKMVANGSGKILNVASTAAFQPGPLMAVYYATKAYVLSFSEALANELKGTGVTVTTLCPGPTATGFQMAASMGDSPLFAGKKLPTATQVAKAGYEGLQQGKTIIVPGFKNKLFIFLVRLAPRAFVTNFVRKIQEV